MEQEEMEMEPPEAVEESPEGAPPAPPGAQGGQGPSPQEMAQLQNVRKAVMTVLYGEQTYDKIPGMLKGAPSPAAGIAATTMFILDQMMQQSQGQMPPDMKQAAAYMLMGELLKIAGPEGMGMKVGPETLNEVKSLIVKQMQGGQRPPPGGPQGAPPKPPGLLSGALGAQ